MATIIQQPDQYSFAGNLKNIVVTTEARITFKLKYGSEVLIESSYDPDLNDKVEIDIKKIIQDTLTSSIPVTSSIAVKDFPSFSFSVDQGAEFVFYAFEGGVDAIIASTWFAGNFLTWQPQTSYVTWNQPQFLSYIALAACNLKVKGYFADGTNQTILFGALAANKVNTANLQYSSIPAKFSDKQPTYIDVWTENESGQRLSYIQRFVLKNTTSDDNCFLFKNSLGGWDSVIFTGTIKNEASSDVKTFSQEDTTNEYQVDLAEKYSKNTGYFISDKHRIWIAEFFKTSERYFLSHRGYFEKLTVLSSTINSQKSNPSSYNFTFSLSLSTKYLNLPRVEAPEAPLEIVDPAGELFFLAPRLSEFPSAEFVDEFILPVQSPYLQEWKKISLGVVKGAILDYIRSQSPGIPQSLLDLSDIDPSLATANVGVSLVKLATGKWGPGSVSIDLSNYFNKSESDERYAFKSHSHDYVPTATFNSHAGDSIKHTTQEEKAKINEAYNDKHTHNNKANLDSINQNLSQTSNVKFNDIIADGSIAFYGGVGSGSTPVASLLDLSDIDASISAAATGTPLVKLASGKWGPGSVSIDLSNYFNKSESDDRYAFKSHSHDYVPIATFNSHTADSEKHITSGERTAWNAKEPSLSNPDTDGKILASTAGGVRSWVNRYVLPIAAAAMLGGVMIGANVNVDAQGRISVAAPYSHPATHPASMIDESATRRFLTDAERANWNDSYDKRHTHGNKANLDSINQNLSQTSNVKFNDVIADGSVGFYGGVGSGSTPVASLLDLSDIDASISGAATGTPLVKLATGKWGAGSVSIDLSNYFNKSESDERYAFKSHSHDYVPTATFNGHTHASFYNTSYYGGNVNDLIQDYRLVYTHCVISSSTNLFPISNNANAILSIATHGGGYNHQLGFSSNGNIYSRRFSAGTPGSWKTLLDSENFSSYALPLSGGTINGNVVSPLIISSTASDNYLTFAIGGYSKSYFGWYSFLGTFLQNNQGNQATIGILDDNTPYYSPNAGFSKYTLVHAGNIGSQSVNYAVSAGNAAKLKSSDTDGVVDLNTFLSGGGSWWNYGQGAIISNQPSWFQYGSVYQLNSAYDSLALQIATTTLHNTTTPTYKIGWRMSNNLGFQNDWKEIYHSGNLTQNLASGYLTYWDGSSLANSPIKTDGTNINIVRTVYATGALVSNIETYSTYPSSYLISAIRTYNKDEFWQGELAFFTTTYGYANSLSEAMRIHYGQNVSIGYTTDLGYKLAVNGSTYYNGPSTINGSLAIAGAFTGATTMVASSYIQAAYYKLGTWEIKQNASEELEFILSGSLKFKITSAGIVSSGGVAFYS